MGLLLVEGVTQADEGYKGLSSFSLMHPNFPCSKFIKLQRLWDKPAISVLYGTFGFSTTCYRKYIASLPDHKQSLIEVHISNEACRRNRRCGEGELLRQFSVRRFNTKLERNSPLVWRKVGRRKEKIQELFGGVGERRETQVLLISTGLEDNYTKRAARVMYDILRYESEGFGIVRSPVSNRRDNRFTFNESHGLRTDCRKGLSIVNNDGTDLTENSMRGFYNRHSNCYAVFLWYPGLQGIFSDEFVKPRNRVFQIPSVKDVKRVIGGKP